jgi:hypothetical protein
MSLLANQTAVNPATNFFATSAGGTYVASVGAGSNVVISGTATNPVVNVAGGEDNPAFYANTQAIGATTSVPSAGAYTFNTVNPAYFVNSNALYRVTVGYEITQATFASAPTGNLNFILFNGASVLMDTANHVMTATIPNGNANIGATLTAIFRPSQAVSVSFGVVNNTTQTVSPLNINYTNYAVEQITDNLTLITSIPQPP